MVSYVDLVTYYLPCLCKTFAGGLNHFHSRMTLHYTEGGQYWRSTFFFLKVVISKTRLFIIYIGEGAFMFVCFVENGIILFKCCGPF